MFAKVLLVAFIGAASASYNIPQPFYSQPKQSNGYEYSAPDNSYDKPMPFDFSYEAKDGYTGAEFSHKSESDGKERTGEYRVDLPDGRTQIVKYYADHHGGYRADVTYEGEAIPYEPPQKHYEESHVSYSSEGDDDKGYSYEPPQQPSGLYGTPHH